MSHFLCGQDEAEELHGWPNVIQSIRVSQGGLCLVHRAFLSTGLIFYCMFLCGHCLKQSCLSTPRDQGLGQQAASCCDSYRSVELLLNTPGRKESWCRYWFAPWLDAVLLSEEKGRASGKDSVALIPALLWALSKVPSSHRTWDALGSSPMAISAATSKIPGVL